MKATANFLSRVQDITTNAKQPPMDYGKNLLMRSM
jgi:hypothetical protein